MRSILPSVGQKNRRVYSASIKPLFVLLLLGTALAQNVGVRPADPQPIQVTSHPQTATVQVLSSGGGTYVASGEQVSGFPTPYEEPLGDAARRLRVEHDKALKAKISEEK